MSKTESNKVIRQIMGITGSQELQDFFLVRRFVEWAPIDHNLELSNGEWRIIREGDCLQILIEELSEDTYLLGCFNPSFLSEVTGIPENVFKVLQKSDACEGIGELVIALDVLPKLASEYAQLDGFGHHFSPYDGDEYEITIDGELFLMFRTN